MQSRLSRSLRPFAERPIAGDAARHRHGGARAPRLHQPRPRRRLSGRADRRGHGARAFEVLDAAWDAGVRYFDAARSYGRGEAFLGAWLRQREIPEGDAVVASKWGYRYTAGLAAFRRPTTRSRTTPSRCCSGNGGRAGRISGMHLDLYQIHSATFDSGVLENREVHRELARLKGKAS